MSNENPDIKQCQADEQSTKKCIECHHIYDCPRPRDQEGRDWLLYRTGRR